MDLSMLNRLLILFILLLTPSSAYAGDGKFTILNKGYRASYSGVLFDRNAVSILLALEERLSLECDIEVEYQTDLIGTKHKLEVDKMKLDMQYLKDQHAIEMDGKKLQVTNLQKELKKRNGVHKAWYIVGGFAAGVLTTTGIAWSIK